MNRIPVDLGARAYTVTVGADAFTELPVHLRDRRRIAVVTQERIPASIIDRAVGILRGITTASGSPAVELFFMGDGEDAKTLATIDDLCRWFAQWGLLRNDAIVGVGGGVVGDTAGFAAATYYRGIDVVHVPTTLLAMVDSAIGGKTGVNLPEGKNLVGAFHQPVAVLTDPTVLATLPEREYKCGLGEIAKYALMQDLELDAAGLLARDAAALTDAISESAAIKARYVEADEFETSGVRAVLNYGHTLAHALETATGHALLHGEAVAIGLVFAGQLAGALERIDNAAVHRHEAIVEGLGLPVQAPAGLRADDLLPIMARDKKSAGTLTFMLAGPTENGSTRIERVDDPDPVALRKAFAAVGVEA